MVSNKLNEPWQHLSMRRKSRNLAVAETSGKVKVSRDSYQKVQFVNILFLVTFPSIHSELHNQYDIKFDCLNNT